MFRRLAEAFQDSNNGQDSNSNYINSQNKYFNTLPNAILSPTSGLKGFDIAIQSADPQLKQYQTTPVKYPNDIFIKDSSPDLNSMAQQCASSSLDKLLSIKNPNANIGCGWMYTPPNNGSPYPKLSKGFIGDVNGPLQNFNPTSDYKKWFFDLQLAKKQVLMDKCKALKGCTDVDSDVFNGVCGYCTDTNQGVPIDNTGMPLYGGDPRGNCSPTSIITSGVNCPPPPGSGSGPQPIVDRTCDPVNGRLSAGCLYNTVLSAGCSDNGSLALALSGSPNPNDYIANLRDGDSVKIYNRVANPPLNLDIFSKGAATVNTVLQEARRLAGNTTQSPNSALGAGARDLCLQAGSIKNYDFCSDLSDGSQAPFDVTCLQQLFRKMGGLPNGSAYPSTTTITSYNSQGTLGAVKQMINQMISSMNSSDYTTQRNAMIQMLGVTPEKLITRAPYKQGVEVIWMVSQPGTQGIVGVLKRTIETDIVQFGGSVNSSTGTVPQVGLNQFIAMMQITDVRAASDFSIKWQFTVDDGAWISVNQPSSFDYTAAQTLIADQPGYVSNNQIQGPTTYNFNSCQQFNGAFPNITKMFYTDSGGGGHTFNLSNSSCSGTPSLSSPYYSLTIEQGAPYISFEVNLNTASFEDTRNPQIFSQLISTTGIEYHTKFEELTYVPGGKGFIRFNNASSSINIFNIAYQAWGTCSFAFRLQSMPVKDSIFAFWVYNKYCLLYLQPINGSSSKMYVQTNMTSDGSQFNGPTSFTLDLNKWYYLEVAQNGAGFDIYCDTIDNIIKNGNYTTSYFTVKNNGPITTSVNNGLYVPNQNSCNVAIGGKAAGFGYATASFIFDVAFVHFFDYYIGSQEVVRDAACNWVLTQFPDSFNTYKTLG